MDKENVITQDELSPSIEAALGKMVQSDDFKSSIRELVKPPEKVEQEAISAVARIGEVSVLGIPIGEALLGGVTSIVVAELVDYAVTATGLKEKIPYPTAVIGGVSAYACHRWMGRFIGQKGANLAACFLAWYAVNELVDIAGWIRGLIPGHSPGEYGEKKLLGAPRREVAVTPRGGGVVAEADKVVRDYYSRAFGR